MKFCAVATSAGTLIPASAIDKQNFDKLRLGVVYQINATIPRNLKFLRKFFALMEVGFSHWEPAPYDPKDTRFAQFGAPKKDEDKFREDILIAAGWCEMVYSIKWNEYTPRAKSISFSKLEDDTVFEGIYNRSLDAILAMVCTNYTKDDLDQVIDELLSFS